MPVKHRTKFEHKCPKTYQEKLRTPGCAIDDKPFEPMSRTIKPPVPFNPPKFKNEIYIPGMKMPNANDIPYASPDFLSKQTSDHTELEPQSYDTEMLAGRQQEASHKGELPETVKTYANLVEGVYAAKEAAMKSHPDPLAAAEAKIKEISPDWRVDRPFSSPDLIQYEHAKTGERVGAYRGTMTTSGEDWITNFSHGSGILETQQDRELQNQERPFIDEMQRMHGPNWQEKVSYINTGHSKGGAHAILSAERTKGQSITFNSSIPKGTRTKMDGSHETWSTTGDPLMRMKTEIIDHPNFKQNTIRSSGMGTPLDEHKLSHFSDPKPPSESDGILPEAGSMGASLAAAGEADKLVDKIEKVLNINSVPPNLQRVIYGVVSGVALDITASKVGYGSNMTTKLRSALSGVGALLVSGNLNDALRKAGFSQDQADALSGTAGGAAAGLTDTVIDGIVDVIKKAPLSLGKSFFKKLAVSSMKGAGMGLAFALFGDLLGEMPGGQTIAQVLQSVGEGQLAYTGVQTGAASLFKATTSFREFTAALNADTITSGNPRVTPDEPPPERGVPDVPEEGTEMTPKTNPEDPVPEGPEDPFRPEEGIEMRPTEGPEDPVPDVPEDPVPDVDPTVEPTVEPTVDPEFDPKILTDEWSTAIDDAIGDDLMSALGISEFIPGVGEIVDGVALASAAYITVEDLIEAWKHPEEFSEEMKNTQRRLIPAAGGFGNQSLLNDMYQRQYDEKHPKEAAQRRWNSILHPKTEKERKYTIAVFKHLITDKAKKENIPVKQYISKTFASQQKAKETHEKFLADAELQATKNGLTKEEYLRFVQYSHDNDSNEAQTQILKEMRKHAVDANFDNLRDYQDFVSGKFTRAEIEDRARQRANVMSKAAQEAEKKGFSNVDFYYHTSPKYQFNPQNNEFTRAADLNLTINQYHMYLKNRAQGNLSVKDALDAAAKSVQENPYEQASLALQDYQKTFGVDLTNEYTDRILDSDPSFEQPFKDPYKDPDPLFNDALHQEEADISAEEADAQRQQDIIDHPTIWDTMLNNWNS